ncbi:MULTISPECIES: aldo/keto reductase [Staphylococcus]|uniref:aldo/keto reductase n=1 Tax=Staphylococcus TaxID=1279 RepID=UPI0002463AAA|nr:MULTISPECIES: aldo/keto reductase [Staphylococcus]QAV30785.1 aldo/keto reductase [Sulfitobacter donghicola]AGZ25642.1 putative methylglyoxal reductase [Staphylococcus pasteuri SP1]KAB7644717.1 aldo/keto reductase [Staphylococcus sp. B2-b]MBN6853235.1 aldo/keto reductase [Staphylococcus warneri]MBT2769993.1 aldo/keto reductase [Staphylococcus warneri]
MKYTTLNNGLKMPLIGFGVYQITNSTEAIESVKSAIRHGYTLIDTAAAYQNEKEVGQAIQSSNVNREDLFVTTKLWVQDVGYENTKKAFQKSLDRLGLEYIDLYLIHQPYGDVHGSWRAMEELYKEGKVKAIGVSNFSPDRLADLIAFNEIKPMVNQIEVNAFHQQHDNEYFNRSQDVHVEAWAPFAEGKNDLFHNETLASIGHKYNKSVAQVVVRWLMQRGITVLAKSVNEDRIQQNIDVFDFELSDEDIAKINELDTNESQFFDHKDPERIKAMSEVKFDI